MPSVWDQFFLPVPGSNRNAAEFWNPSHTIDGVPINYSDSRNYNLPGVMGQVPGRFRDYAQQHPGRWNRLWNLGSQVLQQVPNYRIASPENTIPMFAESFLRNGASGLADLWSSGGRGNTEIGNTGPWSMTAPVPGILQRLLGVDVSNEASNRINAANGGWGDLSGLPDETRYQLAQQGRSNRSLNDIILGIGGQSQFQQQQPQQQGFDWKRISEAISPVLQNIQRQRTQPPSWYGNTANAGGSRVPVNYGSPY